MYDATYHLSLPAGLLTEHGDTATLFLHDQAMPHEELDACVRSGDYLMVLITDLESILQQLPKHEVAARTAIEKLIGDLEYVERRYTVARKTD